MTARKPKAVVEAPPEPPDEAPLSTAQTWPQPRPLCEACGQPAPTSVDDYLAHYAKDGPKAVTLPSGGVFVVDTPAYKYLALTGRLRPEIMALVLDKGAGLLAGTAGLEPDEWATFRDYLVSLSIVEPLVSFDEDAEGRLWVKRIPEDDKAAILEAVGIEV